MFRAPLGTVRGSTAGRFCVITRSVFVGCYPKKSQSGIRTS